MRFKRWFFENLDAAGAGDWYAVVDNFAERFQTDPKGAFKDLSNWLKQQYRLISDKVSQLFDNEGHEEADEDGNERYVRSDHDDQIQAIVDFFNGYEQDSGHLLRTAMHGDANFADHIFWMRNAADSDAVDPKARGIVVDFANHMQQLWEALQAFGKTNPGWQKRI